VFLDLAEDKYNSTSIRESIWEAEMAGNLSTAEYVAGRIGNVIGFGSSVDHSAVVSIQDKTGMANPGYSYRFIFASLKLYEMYELEGDTARGNWCIIPYEYKYDTSSSKLVAGRNYYFGKKPKDLTEIDGFPCIELSDAASSNKVRCCGKYRREYEPHTPKAKNYTCINFPILRYNDVLLMLAEAENEVNGPTSLAFECLNRVRTRAGLNGLSGIGKRVFLSKDFEGLSKENKKQDSILVEKHGWIEITDMCNLPSQNAQTGTARIPMSEYIDTPITFAFLYETNQNSAPQPAWKIRNLQVVNTIKSDNTKNYLPATRMNFTPLDMYTEGLSAYTSAEEVAGKWFLNNINNATNPLMKIQVSPVDSPMNKDWLISGPVKLNMREYDRGIAIKNITGRLENYSYTYEETGNYIVTFAGKKANFETSKEIIQHIFIKVID